ANDTMYVASEYVDGLTVYELLHLLERAGVGLDARVATRIVADALLAADQIGGLLPGKASPRCIFADTVWIASYGGTLISEPFVADFVQRGAFRAELLPGPRGEKSLAALDAYGALELLYRLVLGRPQGPVLPLLAGANLPRELLQLLAARETWTGRADLSRALRRLRMRLFASEGSVAAMVARWAAPLLELRRDIAMPSAALTSEDEATVSLARPGPSMRSRASKA